MAEITEDKKPVEKLSKFVSLKPFKHQQKAFSLCIKYHAFGLLMEQRTGKTLPAIGFIGWVQERLQEGSKTLRAVVITPKSVVGAWQDNFALAKYDHNLVILDGEQKGAKTVAQRAKIIRELKSGIVVLNWDALNFEPVRNALAQWVPNCIVIDESHRMSKWTSRRAKLLHKLGDYCKYKLILSGTPVRKDIRDLFSQWRFLDSNIFGKSYSSFEEKFAVINSFMSWKKFRRVRRPKLLAKLIARKSFRVLLSDCHDVPSREQTLHIQPSYQLKTMHDEMKKEMVVQLSDGTWAMAGGAGVAAIRCQQICGGFLGYKDDAEEKHLRQVNTEKLDVLKDWIEDFVNNSGGTLPGEEKPRNKLVIFCKFVSEIDAIEKALNAMKISCCVIAGKTKNRGEVIRKFQKLKDPQVAVCQVQVASEGIDFTAASTVVYFSMNHSWADFDQSRKRVLGPNQKNPVDYIYMIVEGCIDEDVLEAVQNRQELAEVILDKMKFKRGLAPAPIDHRNDSLDVIQKTSNRSKIDTGESYRVEFLKGDKKEVRYRKTLDGAKSFAEKNGGQVFCQEIENGKKVWMLI